MKITKFGHCCLLIEEGKLRILTDPGMYSTRQDTLKNIDVILITHEHRDHFHVDSVKKILKNNPQAKIFTNGSVGALLKKEGIAYTVIDDGKEAEEKGVLFEAVGTKHAVIHSSMPQSENTGYFVAGRIFYPGDALTDPRRPVEILALPAAGPWVKISEVIDYCRALAPKKYFPVHDAMLKDTSFINGMLARFIDANRSTAVEMPLDTEVEF